MYMYALDISSVLQSLHVQILDILTSSKLRICEPLYLHIRTSADLTAGCFCVLLACCCDAARCAMLFIDLAL